MNDLYSNMHKKYSLSKTLRFELKPIGKTRENIEKNGLIEQDECRAITYKKVKKYYDEYHKAFIEKCMNNLTLDNQDLEQYETLYNKKSNTEAKTEKEREREKKDLKNIQTKLRKTISENFKKDPQYKGLFGKEMINIYLKKMFENDSDKISEISEFDKFVSYFSGFNQNRKNMYVDEEKSTSIAYRIVNENLPLFINNLNIFNNIKKVLGNELDKINEDLQKYTKVNKIEEIFSLKYFNEVLNQKGIENYNIVISGKSEESGQKIKGLNELISEFNQKNKSTNKEKLPKLRQLYKQILSDKIETSFKFETIDSDQELASNIQDYYKNFRQTLFSKNGIINLINNIDHYDINRIFINNDSSLNQISNAIFSDWNKINNFIAKDYDLNYNGKHKIGTNKYEETKKKYFKNTENYSLKYIENLISCENKSIVQYFRDYMYSNNIIENIEKYYAQCKEIINNEYSQGSNNLIQNDESIEKIKNLLDEFKKIQEFIKLLIPKNKIIDKDDNFYNDLEENYVQLLDIIPLYNKTRNYLTQQPFSTEKIKLNFESDTFLNGWDLNKERNNSGVIFRKGNNFYLGIINPYNPKIFINTECNGFETDCYQKMEYKFLPNPYMELPKVFMPQKNPYKFGASDELLYKYKNKYHTKGENFDLEFCHELIDFFKTSINNHADWKNFNFKFKNTNQYNDISEFYSEVSNQGYKIKFKNYSTEYINSLVEIGDLYLFQIYNKDFSSYSKGKPNLHTMYWRALFDEENLKNIVFKLNGNAEIFYRKASIKPENRTIHKKGEKIKKKNVNNFNKSSESQFTYDLIKDKRYTVDKFQFHVPIVINFINENQSNLNETVKEYLKYNDVNVIGIDRGERNLLYITVINPQGEIIKGEQYSLNKIINEYNGLEYETDYHTLLDNKEKERKEARESWKTIKNIKELKEGYLSQVIHKIVYLMEKYKAIIVIEDLNRGFKNSRIKVEKQVYQKFEKMLINKLNYLVFKDKDFNEEGGLLNGYQLTNKFESFNKIGNQSGILFYIPAWCTSKIDPTTGFVNFLKPRYESIEKSKTFTSKFDNICFNEQENYFEFKIDYSKFNIQSYGIRKNWTICTYGDRIETYKNSEKNNNWDTRKINLTDEFKKLFDNYNISYIDIKKQILTQNSKEFWERLLYLLKLTLQMRNSVPNTEEDYLISPIKNSNGIFYNSNNHDSKLPIDADANGAYNIACKGLMFIDKIRNTNKKERKLKISNQDWLQYVQEKNM